MSSRGSRDRRGDDRDPRSDDRRGNRRDHRHVHVSAADQRCRATAHLAAIELALGGRERAARVVATAFDREHDEASDDARALLYMSLAAVAAPAGSMLHARLARAASAENIAPELAARIEAVWPCCPAQQGRLQRRGGAGARAPGRPGRRCRQRGRRDPSCRSQVAVRRGDAGRAAADLRGLTQTLRRRGDEIGAVNAEVELAWARAAARRARGCGRGGRGQPQRGRARRAARAARAQC